MVVQRALNAEVVGSSPASPSIEFASRENAYERVSKLAQCLLAYVNQANGRLDALEREVARLRGWRDRLSEVDLFGDAED